LQDAYIEALALGYQEPLLSFYTAMTNFPSVIFPTDFQSAMTNMENELNAALTFEEYKVKDMAMKKSETLFVRYLEPAGIKEETLAACLQYLLSQ